MPGIRYVIDLRYWRVLSVTAIVLKYSVYLLSQFLRQVRTSVWDAVAGVEAGICIRLYSQDDFISRPNLQTQNTAH
ncbi:hypothetical protein P4S68_20925 [Pseudoalteromonas sp. Hal099]